MYHHEFIVEKNVSWVKREVPKLESFATLCPHLGVTVRLELPITSLFG